MDVPSDYEVLEEIGRGESSTVYRARDLVLRRRVAIKELHERHRGDARLLEQFLDGARLLAGQKHEAIVQVFGVCPTRGWVVMELLRGGIDKFAEQGPAQPEAVRRLLRCALEALDFLHAQGRLHGAIKPSNLLLDDAGRLKLSDATGALPDGELRRPAGLPRYLAPELLSREFGEPGPSSDLYGLGLVFLEVVAGTGLERLAPGFQTGADRTDLDWMRWHSSSEKIWPPAAKVAPSLPTDLATVIDGLIHKPVAERYASSGQALRDLGEGAKQTSTRATAPGPEPRSSPFPPEPGPRKQPSAAHDAASRPVTPEQPRHPRPDQSAGPVPKRLKRYLEKPWVLYPACAALILPTLFIVLQPENRAGPSRAAEPVLRPPSEAAAARIGKATSRPETAGATSRKPLEPTRVPIPNPPTSGPAVSSGPGEIHCFTGHEGAIRSVAISCDGLFAVSGGHDNTVWLWDLARRRAISHQTGDGQWVIKSVSINEDGSRALSADSSGALRLWDVRQGGLVREFGYRQGTIYGACLTLDGRRAFTGGLNADPLSFLHLWDVERGTSIGQLAGHDGEIWCVALSRDGLKGLSHGVDRTVRLWDLETLQEAARFPRSIATINCLTLAPAGDIAYLGTNEGLIVRWDLADKSEISPPIQAHAGPANGIAVDAAGRVVLTGGSDGNLRLWERDGMKRLGTFTGHAGRVRSVALADDGRTAISGGDDQKVHLWNLSGAVSLSQ